jgi:hypothetical protein
VPAAERSHESAVENEHHVFFVFKIREAHRVAVKIVQLEIRGGLGKLDFRHTIYFFLKEVGNFELLFYCFFFLKNIKDAASPAMEMTIPARTHGRMKNQNP